MAYKCPICTFRTAKAAHLAGHMINAFNLFTEHWEWIESHSIDFPEILGLKDGRLGKGSRKALITVIEKECKILD